MSAASSRLAYLIVGALIALAGGAIAFDAPFGLRDEPTTATIEVAFSPGDQPTRLIVNAIQAARKQILVQAFSFTHRDIADALLAARRRGIDVAVIADRRQAFKLKNSVIPSLASRGVAVFLDGRHDSAHDKVMVIDAAEAGPTVISGSFNFTFAAHHKNAENLLVIRGNPALAKAYFDNWQRHRQHAPAYRLASYDDTAVERTEP